VLFRSNVSLRESLESLFGDLVGLAQHYEIKEEEARQARDSASHVVDKLKTELQAERQKYAKLVEDQSQIRYENDILSRKYEKAKEKLQEARQQQRDRPSTSRPLSYMNHLNSSSLTSKSHKSSQLGDKENSVYSHNTHSRTYR